MRKILIIDDHDDLASLLTAEFSALGHVVKMQETRDEALELLEHRDFDVVITDLDNAVSIHSTAPPATCVPDCGDDARIRAFKICVPNYEEGDSSEEELRAIVEKTLENKARSVDKRELLQDLHEKIEFEVPSLISLMHSILNYLMRRVEKIGVVNPETSNLFVALDEAFVNAVKHGNKFDSSKQVRITADVSPDEARFTIEDEGDGFNVNEIPDPLDPQNLFKASGRGVLFIYNIMDEVTYNDRGNRLTMIKKRTD